MGITVIIHTYNSEKYLRRVLESVKSFDEVIIADMHSQDATLEMAAEYGCKVFFCPQTKIPEEVRQLAIDQAGNDWVLVVDSDEIVPPALTSYLKEFAEKETDVCGLWIPRKNYVMGTFVHGSYPNHILRFFRKSVSVWPKFVHTMPKVDGRTEKIPGSRKDLAFIHLDPTLTSSKMNKMNIYSTNDVEKRGMQKFGMLQMFYAPFWRFFKAYIVKGGIRDGRAGLINACTSAIYKFCVIAKMWEKEYYSQHPEER